jgi:hypothetical protein
MKIFSSMTNMFPIIKGVYLRRGFDRPGLLPR